MQTCIVKSFAVNLKYEEAPAGAQNVIANGIVIKSELKTESSPELKRSFSYIQSITRYL